MAHVHGVCFCPRGSSMHQEVEKHMNYQQIREKEIYEEKEKKTTEKELFAVSNCLNGLLDKHFETSRWYSLLLLSFCSSRFHIISVLAVIVRCELCSRYMNDACNFILVLLLVRSCSLPLFAAVNVHRWEEKKMFMGKYVAWVAYTVYDKQSHILVLIILFFVKKICWIGRPLHQRMHTSS